MKVASIGPMSLIETPEKTQSDPPPPAVTQQVKAVDSSSADDQVEMQGQSPNLLGLTRLIQEAQRREKQKKKRMEDLKKQKALEAYRLSSRIPGEEEDIAGLNLDRAA